MTVVVTRAAHRTAVDALEIAGAELIVATGANEPDRVRNALVQLGGQGITSILLEGGPHLAGAFLDAGEVDEIRLFLAPVVLGGSSARDPLEGEGAERIAAEARHAAGIEHNRAGVQAWVDQILAEGAVEVGTKICLAEGGKWRPMLATFDAADFLARRIADGDGVEAWGVAEDGHHVGEVLSVW